MLKPKAYSMVTFEGIHKKTAKGIQFCVRNQPTHGQYIQVWQEQLELVRVVHRFQSTNNVIHTIKQRKWALSATDTKRAWVNNNDSLPYGHWRLNDDGEPPAQRPRLA